MFFVRVKCPHCADCNTVRLFNVGEYTAACSPSVLEKEQVSVATMSAARHRHSARFSAAGTCCACNGPVLLELEIDRDYLKVMREHILEAPQHRYDGPPPKILRMWPEPPQPYAHPALPENVRKDFITLQNILPQLPESPWIGISACRTILENAVEYLGGEGGTLHKRLHNLADKGILSSVLLDWADCIRLSGNAAVHDCTGSIDEAEEIVEFTRLFLQYVFELPDRVRIARERAGKPPLDTSPPQG